MYFLLNVQKLVILSVVYFTLKITNLWTWLFNCPTHFVWNKDIQNLRQTAIPKIYKKTGELDKVSNNLLKWNLTGKEPF